MILTFPIHQCLEVTGGASCPPQKKIRHSAALREKGKSVKELKG